MAVRRGWRWAGGGLAVLLVLVVALVLLWNWDWFIPLVDARASAAIGRPVTIAHLHVRLGRVTTVVADDVRIANPPGWTADPPLAAIAHLTVSADVIQYIRNSAIVLPQLTLDAPVIAAAARPDGSDNYTLKLASSGPSSGPPTQIGRLDITDGQARVVIPKLKADFTLAVATRAAPAAKDAVPATVAGAAAETAKARAAAAAEPEQIVVDAKGTYAGQPITGTLIGGALLSLRDAAHPYPIDMHLANGPTTVALVGTVSDPLHLSGVDIKLQFAGPDLALLQPLTGIDFPKTPAYRATGEFDYADRRIQFRNFAGVIGNTDIAGTIAVDPATKPADAVFDLHSRHVDLADLAGFIGAQPGHVDEKNMTAPERAAKARALASPKLLPDTPIDIPKLTWANVHLKYRGDHIEGRSIPIDSITVAMDIVNGHIALHPLDLGIGTGRIDTDIDLTPVSEGQTRLRADADFERVDLSRLMEATHTFKGAGTISGKANIESTGNSMANLLGHGNGGAALYMTGGDLSALLVDLSGLEFGNALLSALGIPRTAKIQCFIAEFGLTHGVMKTRALLLDTSEAIVHGSGDVNLEKETIDYQLKTESKHFSIGSLPGPINIDGTFKSPSIKPGAATIVRGAAAVGLGILAGPLALLPTIQFGTGDTHQCQGLLADLHGTPAREVGKAVTR